MDSIGSGRAIPIKQVSTFLLSPGLSLLSAPEAACLPFYQVILV